MEEPSFAAIVLFQSLFSGEKEIWRNISYLSADHNHNQFRIEEWCFEVSVPTILGESNSNSLKFLWAYRDDHLQTSAQTDKNCKKDILFSYTQQDKP